MYGFKASLKSLNDFKQKIKTSHLIPSHRILLNDIDLVFDLLQKEGFCSMFDLMIVLKSKKKAEFLAEKTNIPLEYIVVLRREVLSFESKARVLDTIDCISDKSLEMARAIGAKTTKQIHSYVHSWAVSLQTMNRWGLSKQEVEVLRNVVDICHLRYVSEQFCNMLMHTSCNSVSKIACAQSGSLYGELTAVNEFSVQYKGKFGVNDIQFLIDDANFIGSNLVD